MDNPSRANRGYWYLAMPYSTFPGGPLEACSHATRLAGAFHRYGFLVFSPIIHGVPVCAGNELHIDMDHWMDFARALLRPSIGVLQVSDPFIPGSDGHEEEMAFAKELGKRVIVLESLDNPIEAALLMKRADPGWRRPRGAF